MKHEGERHLWIWVDTGHELTGFAMDDDELPVESPEVDGLTDAWVARYGGTVWHWNHVTGWTVAQRVTFAADMDEALASFAERGIQAEGQPQPAPGGTSLECFGRDPYGCRIRILARI
jgi:hypothetical protein